MITKGIILAGGTGSRLSPLTKSTNKQLLPLFDKPLIFYPLSILMQNDIRDILIIVNKGQVKIFKKILPEKNNLGIKIRYLEQSKPRGLPEAFIIGKNFIKNENVALILGDNFFFSRNKNFKLLNNFNFTKGAKIFLYNVKKPELYGIATINKKKQIVNIQEKPKKSKSNYAITGVYLFDNKVINFSKSLKLSKRNELEITDLLKKYLNRNELNMEFISKRNKWFDAGSVKDLNFVSNFVANIQNHKKNKIACLEEIAFKKKWIGKKQIKNSIKFYGNCEYSSYLKLLVKIN